MFKEKSVRLIDINNGIDSANQQDSDFTSFLNIMNEWNARDAIRKIQAVFLVMFIAYGKLLQRLKITHGVVF